MAVQGALVSATTNDLDARRREAYPDLQYWASELKSREVVRDLSQGSQAANPLEIDSDNESDLPIFRKSHGAFRSKEKPSLSSSEATVEGTVEKVEAPEPFEAVGRPQQRGQKLGQGIPVGEIRVKRHSPDLIDICDTEENTREPTCHNAPQLLSESLTNVNQSSYEDKQLDAQSIPASGVDNVMSDPSQSEVVLRAHPEEIRGFYDPSQSRSAVTIDSGIEEDFIITSEPSMAVAHSSQLGLDFWREVGNLIDAVNDSDGDIDSMSTSSEMEGGEDTTKIDAIPEAVFLETPWTKARYEHRYLSVPSLTDIDGRRMRSFLLSDRQTSGSK